MSPHLLLTMAPLYFLSFALVTESLIFVALLGSKTALNASLAYALRRP